MLEGLKIVEFATYVAAPSAAAVMADWGAEVIKVESGRGDPTRRTFDLTPHLEGNPVFEVENHGKRGIVLDIAKPAGRAALLRLLKGADVFLTNVRLASLKRARLDYDSLTAEFPELIYTIVTGYGLEGEGSELPSFDAAGFWSRAGVGGAFTPRGAEPPLCRPGFGDAVCSLSTVSATLAAVIERKTTGRGRLVETSLIRSGTYALSWDFSIQLKWGRLASQRTRTEVLNPISNYFQTGDGRWLGVFARDGRDDFAELTTALGAPGLKADPRFHSGGARAKHVAECVAALDAAFAKVTLDEIGPRLIAADLVWSPLNLPRDTVDDPLAIAAGCFVDTVDGQGVAMRQPASPARFPGYDDGPRRAAPNLGEHTREVLAEAGYSNAEIDTLIAEGAAT